MTILRPKHLFILDEIGRAQAPTDGVRLCFEILALADAIDHDCARRLERHGMSEARFVALAMLTREPEGLSPSALADRSGVTRGTVTGLVDGLERKGLAVRVPDSIDGRALSVRATGRGRALAAELLAEHAGWIDGLFAGLGDRERRALSGLLGHVWTATDEGQSAPNRASEAVRAG